MKKRYGHVLATSFLTLLVLGYFAIKNPIKESYITSPYFNTTNPLEWINQGAPPALLNPENVSQVISTKAVVSDLFAQRNLSNEEQQSLHTWNHLKQLITHAKMLPNALEAIKEARVAWNNLMTSFKEEKLHVNGSALKRGKEKQCPHFLSKMNASKLDDNGFELRLPCGLTQGSSITFIGIPNGLLGAHDWGEEERCPSPDPEKNKKVDELDQCNEIVGKDDNRTIKASRQSKGATKFSMIQDGKPRKYFPFKQNYLSVATIKVGSEGIQMTFDGKHITSFAFRETLEPWLMVNEELWNEAWTYGDIQLTPFVDYYNLITRKTTAICIFGVISAKFVMKTDDDAFVRVDEVLLSLRRINTTCGLLYGLINSDSHPHRDPDSKWYISLEEWPEDSYPHWEHGPGYVVSSEIAKAIYKKQREGRPKRVAVGTWIADMKRGLNVRYNDGCKDNYVVAHYQGPREMLCL
ncbi:unnamed protein product [Fraxinus pennsylvanica]|uniref:Hexosyltransferase n=1 Tax=Fraxinus pennsylvanica TaxID=56036 RepID=A0AAD2A0V2_9LAMI|nr:unnamed protein product [Fraxinus pennsylvanica]